jgi:hypothetical protein
VECAGIGGDVDDGPIEVDVAAPQSGEFTEPNAGVRGGEHEHSAVRIGHALGDADRGR